jgi:hypothetical protein
MVGGTLTTFYIRPGNRDLICVPTYRIDVCLTARTPTATTGGRGSGQEDKQ